jgi:hypothetical protein
MNFEIQPAGKSVRGPLYPRGGYYLLLALLTIVVGFFPSYFGRLNHTDAAHHFHGVSATLWMLLLTIQVWLVQSRSVLLHRTLGWLSLLVAPSFLVSGLLIVRVMLGADSGFNRTFGARLAFADLTTLGFFAAAVGVALWKRRNSGLHGRLMVSTAVIGLPPAIARILGNHVPAVQTFDAAFYGSYLISEVIVGFLIWDDVKKGSVRAPYPLVGALFALQGIAFAVLPHVGWWSQLCKWMGTA